MSEGEETPRAYPRLRRLRVAVRAIEVASIIVLVAAFAYFFAAGLYLAVMPGVFLEAQRSGTVELVIRWAISCGVLAVVSGLGFSAGHGRLAVVRFCVVAMVAAAALAVTGFFSHESVFDRVVSFMNIVNEVTAVLLVSMSFVGFYVIWMWGSSMRAEDPVGIRAHSDSPDPSASWDDDVQSAEGPEPPVVSFEGNPYATFGAGPFAPDEGEDAGYPEAYAWDALGEVRAHAGSFSGFRADTDAGSPVLAYSPVDAGSPVGHGGSLPDAEQTTTISREAIDAAVTNQMPAAAPASVTNQMPASGPAAVTNPLPTAPAVPESGTAAPGGVDWYDFDTAPTAKRADRKG